MRLMILLIFVILGIHVASSSLFRISISAKDRESLQSHMIKSDESVSSACDDYTLVDNPDELHFPERFSELKRPWVDNNMNLNTMVARSTFADEGLQKLFRLKVPGLNGVTIQDVFDTLIENDCLSFPYGGSVRDQFLATMPADLDMESNCDATQLNDICEQNWESACEISKNGIVHIGDEEAIDGNTDRIDAASWEGKFFGTGEKLEYTTNALTYFSNLSIVIDLTGYGISDTCLQKIRIPIDAKESWFSDGGYKRIYRFWKLRIKGYTAIDDATMSFIVEKAKSGIEDNNDFTSFYCDTVLKGNWSNNTCEIDSKDCSAALENKKAYDKYFVMDLGANFWKKSAKELIRDLESLACSSVSSYIMSTRATSNLAMIMIAFFIINNCYFF